MLTSMRGTNIDMQTPGGGSVVGRPMLACGNFWNFSLVANTRVTRARSFYWVEERQQIAIGIEMDPFFPFPYKIEAHQSRPWRSRCRMMLTEERVLPKAAAAPSLKQSHCIHHKHLAPYL
jgi:hypothetical protein